ncbi:RNA directed DNA polymerase (reverse transcriptase) [Echinococcus multilocularis]|uniref:RNA directed DNA polymerase (Reverse transcriptase) n=1 Tax=Echinococcus multilocularis TaxID=6211 RepID=A0A0S4MLY9_ECHMU|nr:RNA directed DNA polymerase (reverse transcriptase) [Echinococcus multilocularis]
MLRMVSSIIQRIFKPLPKIHLILRPSAFGSGITCDIDIDQCCTTLAQLVINREEQTLTWDFFLLFQKADEDDEECTKYLRHLAERGFSCRLPNKVVNWLTVQFRYGIRPPFIDEKLCGIKTISLSQLVKHATKKRQEL